MGRQSPILLKCHFVLKTGVTDIFCTFHTENVVIWLLDTHKAASFHFWAIYRVHGQQPAEEHGFLWCSGSFFGAAITNYASSMS